MFNPDLEMNMNTNPMRRFGECNVFDCPAVNQPGEYINARLLDGKLRVEVDIYSATCPEANTPAFDVDRWEREQFVMEEVPIRENWRQMFRAARALLNGRAVDFGGGQVISMASWPRRFVDAA